MNKNDIQIRIENKDDYRDTETLVRNCFYNLYCPGCTEHFVLKKIREQSDFLRDLNYVMVKDGQIIGQNVFVKAKISCGGGVFDVLTMGPICIDERFRGQGLGKRLLDYSLSQATIAGFKAVCIEGDLNFYSKCGFVKASEFSLRYHGIEDGQSADFFLAKELVKGALKDVSGVYHTPDVYFSGFTLKEEFEAYEATFDYREKMVKEGQLNFSL